MDIKISLNRFHLTNMEDRLEATIYRFLRDIYGDEEADDMATDLTELIMDRVIMETTIKVEEEAEE